jgi:hypothetical protein
MFLLRETVDAMGFTTVLDENTADRSFGLQEGRNLCKKITDRAKTSNAGGYDMGIIKDSLAGVLDGLNVHILQFAEKDKSTVLNKISVLLDDAFTEISKVK